MKKFIGQRIVAFGISKSAWIVFISAMICHSLLFPVEATIDITLQMQLGNPSGAAADINNHAHYLIQRTVEAIDYSVQLGEAVWAPWDLTAVDVGGGGRNSTHYPDTNLPPNFYHVTTADYNGVGTNNFNRGHLYPSDDRTDNTNDNKLVFYMSNIFPQSALNNQGIWGNFEDYCRSLLSTNELLITCGGSGFGTNTIPSGKAFIPSTRGKSTSAFRWAAVWPSAASPRSPASSPFPFRT